MTHQSDHISAESKGDVQQKRIGYLTSQYPAPSHTFIRREIAQLRKTSLDIAPYSIRSPVSGLDSPRDIAAQKETFYVLQAGLLTYARAHVRAVLRRPARYVSTLFKAMGHRVPGAKALVWSVFHFAESIVLADRLERDGISHLHNHFANSAATVGMLAAGFNQISWSLTLHGISETDYPAGLLLARKIRAANFISCVSWFGRAQAMRIVPADQWDKFHTVRCGIALDELPPVVTRKPGRKHKQIICVARLSSEKGHPGLLRAFAGLIEDGHDAELVLVGDGPEQDIIEATCERLSIADRVRFTGRLSEKDTLAEIADSDLLVLPSFMEGLPVVLMEAMALGVPVVASRVAGVPELIDHGQSGLLFDPADWNGLESALTLSLADEGAATARAARAREKIIGEFDIQLAVAALPKLFANAMLKENQKTPGRLL